ncbi:DUF4436 domain-containing protein [Streptomyces aureoverticillatus]|nr:DUF4436 domain-containing protein [Streptomyces aureoverticillatus]
MDTRCRAGEAAPDRVDIEASVQRVDAAARELTLRVLVTPRGNLAEAGGISPAQTLTLQTSSSIRRDLTYPAHSRIATVDVPVRMTLSNTDALFAATIDTAETDGAAVFHAALVRSTSVLIFAVFMMAAMWALAVAVGMRREAALSAAPPTPWRTYGTPPEPTGHAPLAAGSRIATHST